MNLADISRVQFPRSYIVWDLETTGFSILDDRIIEVAYAVVRDGVVTESYSSLLNHRMEIPAEATAVHGITYEMCGIEGVPPAEGIYKLVEALKTLELPCITHNGFKFDVPFLLAEVKRHEGRRNVELENILWAKHIDTAVMVKAAKLGMLRKWNEGFGDFAKRVMDVYAKGVKYNLATCCEELLVDVSGIKAHRAAVDCLMTMMVYERLIAITSP